MLTAQQMHKCTQTLFNQIYASETYEQVKQLLYTWRDHSKAPPQAIVTFLKVVNIIATQQPELLDDLNRCLVKDYTPSVEAPSLTRIRQLAVDNPNASAVLDTVIGWLRT